MAAADFLATCPEDLGIDSEKLEAVFARAKRDVDDGTLKSAQVAVARRGKLAGLRTYGTVQHGGVEREVPATDRTFYTIFSCTKAIVGAATWTVCEDGLLRIEEKVSDIIPEFGTNGKENITVEQVGCSTSADSRLRRWRRRNGTTGNAGFHGSPSGA